MFSVEHTCVLQSSHLRGLSGTLAVHAFTHVRVEVSERRRPAVARQVHLGKRGHVCLRVNVDACYLIVSLRIPGSPEPASLSMRYTPNNTRLGLFVGTWQLRQGTGVQKGTRI